MAVGGPAAMAAEQRRVVGEAKLANGDSRAALEDFEAGLRLLSAGCAPHAVQETTAALQLCAARAHLLARQAGACEERCQAVLQASPEDARALHLLARAKAGRGDLRGALRALAAVAGGEAEDLRASLRDAEGALAAGDAAWGAGVPAEALREYQGLEKGLLFDSAALLTRMGRCYLALGEAARARRLALAVLRRDGVDADADAAADAHLLLAQADFAGLAAPVLSDEWERDAEAALRPLRQALRLDPEHSEAARLRRQGKALGEALGRCRRAVGRGQWSEAEGLLSGLLDGAGTFGQLPAKLTARCRAARAQVRLELGDAAGAESDAALALQVDDRLPEASVARAQALQKMERWEDAAGVLEALHAWRRDEDSFWKAEWAKFHVRRVRRPDYYAVLGVATEATQAQIKAAYRRLSAELHPDKQLQRNPDADPDEVRSGFQLLGEAFEILGTAEKREYFDKGYDAPGIRECLQVRRRSAGQRPCARCGEDEPGEASSDGLWYCHLCLGRSSWTAAPADGFAAPRTAASARTAAGPVRPGAEVSQDVSSAPPGAQAEAAKAAAPSVAGVAWSFGVPRALAGPGPGATRPSREAAKVALGSPPPPPASAPGGGAVLDDYEPVD